MRCKALVCTTRDMEICLSAGPSIEGVARVALVCRWWIGIVEVLAVILGLGVVELVRRSTQVWEAVMRQVFVGICVLVVARGAIALIVVYEIMTGARLASGVRAIRNVLAPMDTCSGGFVCKATVAIANEVVPMHACGTLIV